MMQGFQLSPSSSPEAHTALGPEQEFVRKVGVLRGRAAAMSHRAETAPLARHLPFSPNTHFPAGCKDWDEPRCCSPQGLIPEETACLQKFLPQTRKLYTGKQNIHLSRYFTNQLKISAMLHGPSANHCSGTALCFNPLSLPQR